VGAVGLSACIVQQAAASFSGISVASACPAYAVIPRGAGLSGPADLTAAQKLPWLKTCAVGAGANSTQENSFCVLLGAGTHLAWGSCARPCHVPTRWVISNGR